VRGIFVGFPVNQAGWSIFIPASRHILASADESFDRDFLSTTALMDKIYHDSLLVHPTPTYIDPSEPIAHTGPPMFTHEATDPNAPWTPYTAIPPKNKADPIYKDDIPIVDTYQPEEIDVQYQTQSKYDYISDSRDNWIDIEETALFHHYMAMKDPIKYMMEDKTGPFNIE
jgi:hypothetical protein